MKKLFSLFLLSVIFMSEVGAHMKENEAFAHKVVVVTGAAQGIGKCIAEHFAQEGATVILNDINEEALAAAVRELGERKLTAFGYAANISQDSDVKKMIADIVEQHGTIDVLINNAAISLKNPDNTKKCTIDIAAEEWDYILSTNLKSVFLCSKYAAQHMIEKRSGKIVNLSSILGKTGCGGDKYDNYLPISSTSASHYCASKAGIISLTRSMARELAKYNVYVNAVAPGAIYGGMGKFGGEVVDRMKSQIPLGDLGMQEDVAHTILFLCSEQAKYITGETVNINGGWLMD